MKFSIATAIALFVSGITFANQMCLELCPSCENSTEESCQKLEELCACTQKREYLQKFEHDIAKETLKCDSVYCSYKVTIDGDSINFKRIKSKFKIQKTANTEIETASEETMNEECKSMCDVCGENFETQTCKRIETLCKCTYFLELETQKAEKVKQDSIKKIEQQLQKIENANRLGKLILDKRDTSSSCIIFFTINASDMQIIDIKKKRKK